MQVGIKAFLSACLQTVECKVSCACVYYLGIRWCQVKLTHVPNAEVISSQSGQSRWLKMPNSEDQNTLLVPTMGHIWERGIGSHSKKRKPPWNI